MAPSARLLLVIQAVEQYCLDSEIVDAQERQYVTHLVNSLFDLGVTSLDGLLAGLADAMGRPTPQTLALCLDNLCFPHEGRPVHAEQGNKVGSFGSRYSGLFD